VAIPRGTSGGIAVVPAPEVSPLPVRLLIKCGIEAVEKLLSSELLIVVIELVSEKAPVGKPSDAKSHVITTVPWLQ